MNAAPVARAVAGGLARRRVQTVVIGLVVLISTAAAVLATALLAESSAPFDHAFAARHGAHVTAAINPARASPAQLAATTRLPQVTAAAGPFAETTIGVPCTPVTVRLGGPDGIGLEQMTLAGRAAPAGPVDGVCLLSGHWVRGPGQIVLQYDYMGGHIPVGSTLDRDRAAGNAPADGCRHRRLGHRDCRRLGTARGDPGAAATGDAGQRADAVPVPRRGHGHGSPG